MSSIQPLQRGGIRLSVRGGRGSVLVVRAHVTIVVKVRCGWEASIVRVTTDELSRAETASFMCRSRERSEQRRGSPSLLLRGHVTATVNVRGWEAAGRVSPSLQGEVHQHLTCIDLT
jgi:hypothetical protein